MEHPLIKRAEEVRGAWGTPSFMGHLIGALSVHDPEFLIQAARSFLEVSDSEFLAQYDKEQQA